MGTQSTAFISTALDEYLRLSSEIGGDVKEQSQLVVECFTMHNELLRLVETHSKPSESDWDSIVKSYSKPVVAVVEFKGSDNRGSLSNHLSAVSSSIWGLGWIHQSPAPAVFVKSMRDAAEFYTNKIMRDYKNKDHKHAEWAKSLLAIWDRLHDYIKQYHTTGPSWNSSASPATEGDFSQSPSKTASGGIPPVPCLKPQTFTAPQSKSDSAGRAGLFAQLNCGETITSGLRKVNDDMKTHKNPQLRAHSLVPQSGAGGGVSKSASPRVTPPRSKPVLELVGNKWVVENYRGEHLSIEDTITKQTVYVCNCADCVLIVKGKINSIILDQCKKMKLVFDSLISSLEVINCQGVKVQTLGNLSTVTIDKTDDCQVYLSPESKKASIFTAKSSTVNILIPDDSGEFKEYPVPEQFRTMLTADGLKTVPTEAPE